MGLLSLGRRFMNLRSGERSYFLRRYLDMQIHRRSGFSQFGEDASIAAYFRAVGRRCSFYLDIGANHPVLHSNSYTFYRDGASGVLVEANPTLARRLKRKRPRDLVLNVGIVPEGSGTMELRIMDMDGLSTLSQSWGDKVEADGMARQAGTAVVEVVGINDLLSRHVADRTIDLASIDIEGMDGPVLTAWDFDRWRPHLFCVETTMALRGELRRDESLYALMTKAGYRPLFETYSNTIFVDQR